MPNVNGKKFPYTKAGKADAKKAVLKNLIAKGKGGAAEEKEEATGKYSFLKKFSKK